MIRFDEQQNLRLIACDSLSYTQSPVQSTKSTLGHCRGTRSSIGTWKSPPLSLEMKRIYLIIAIGAISLSVLLSLVFINCGGKTTTVTTIFTVSEDTTQYVIYKYPIERREEIGWVKLLRRNRSLICSVIFHRLTQKRSIGLQNI